MSITLVWFGGLNMSLCKAVWHDVGTEAWRPLPFRMHAGVWGVGLGVPPNCGISAPLTRKISQLIPNDEDRVLITKKQILKRIRHKTREAQATGQARWLAIL